MTRTVLFVALLLAAVVPVMAAGGDKGDAELGFYGGIADLDDYARAPFGPDEDAFYGLRVGYFFTPSWSAEVSLQQLSTETQSGADFDTESVRLNLLHNFRPGKVFRPFFTVGVGAENTDVEGFGDEDDPSYNAGLGLRWRVSQRFGLRLDGRVVNTNVGGGLNERQVNIESSLGASWLFGGAPPADTDGDGVNDRRDRCPDTPRGAVVDASGCPVDSDGDGVADGLDRCANTPAGTPVDDSGCPKDTDGDGVHDGLDRCAGTPSGARVDQSGCPFDTDGDGVADGIDRCPDTPNGASVDARGCPKDSDRDGVPDGIDKCANTPTGATVDARGCPKDRDGDGVPDGIDRCPATAAGVEVDTRGCPRLVDEARKVLVLEGVNFETNSAQLTSEARRVLDRVADSLRQWPELRVEVAGHTDSSGRDSYNLDLSARRAQAVREYLVGKGVSGSMLSAKGYGEARPISDNDTAQGRRQNRRVELRKLD